MIEVILSSASIATTNKQGQGLYNNLLNISADLGSINAAAALIQQAEAGTYGSATTVPKIVVDSKKNITSIANVAISGVPPGGAAGGELSGTYPNPTILNSAVISKLLTGFVSGAGVITAADSILSSIQKLDGNVTLKLDKTLATGKIFRGDGTNIAVASTSSFADTYGASELLYSNGANNVAGLTTANNGVLITSGAGVPSISSTLPNAVQDNIIRLGTITSGVWNGTPISADKGGTGLILYTIGDLIYASGATTLSKLADVAVGSVLISGGIGAAPSWSSSPVISTSVTCPIFQGSSAAAGSLTLRANSSGTDGDIIFQSNSTTNRMRILSTGQPIFGADSLTYGAGRYAEFRKDQNSTTIIDVINNTDGTAAFAGMFVGNAAGKGFSISYRALAYTAVPLYADTAVLRAESTVTNGLFISTGGAIPIRFAISDAEKWRISGSGNLSNTGSNGTAYLHLTAGTISVAPICLTSGSLTTGANIIAGQIQFLNDDYYLTITTGTAVQKIGRVLTGSATINPGGISESSSASATITVTGAVSGDKVIVTPASGVISGGTNCNNIVIWGYVSAANTVTVRIVNNDISLIATPASGIYYATVIKNV